MVMASPGSRIASTDQIADGVIVNADVSPTAAIDESKISGAVDKTSAENVGGVKTFTSDPIVPAEAFGAGWDGSNEIPTKNDVYDKILSMLSSRKVGATTHDLATANGAQNIAHGLGAIPSKVRVKIVFFSGVSFNITEGVYDGTTTSYVYAWCVTNGASTAGAGANLRIVTDAGTNYKDAVITMDATNIILTWTKSGSPTGTCQILWEATK